MGTTDQRLVPEGAWNHTIVVLGAPGSGKSEWGVRRALSLMCAPAYGVAHSIGRGLPDRLHDGTRVPVVRHRSVAELSARLSSDAAGLHAVATPTADELLEYAGRLGEASLALHGGARGVPVVALVDEGVALGGASPRRLGERMRWAVTQRRHLHLGVIVLVQSARLLHYSLLELATEVVCFRTANTIALRRLGEVGMPGHLLYRLPLLGRFASVVWRPGG